MSLILSILGIGFIVFIHEMGHFLFAKAFKVAVVEFSIGMGPVIVSKQFGETKYSLRLLPLGGSCMMLGEEDEEKGGSERRINELSNGTFAGDTVTADDEDNISTVDGRRYSKDAQFYNKKAWQRFLIIFAGPLFNLILAFLMSLILTAKAGWDRPLIIEVTENSPAMEAGITEGCYIKSLKTDGVKTRVCTARDIQLFFTANETFVSKGEEIEVSYIDTDGNLREGIMKARYNDESGRYLVGFSYSLLCRPCESLSEIFRYAFYNIRYTFKTTVESLRMMFRGEVGRNDVKGIVGMVAIMDENVEYASDNGTAEDVFLTLLDILILLSGTLGIMNLLPLPALDGGRIVFILIEMITGHSVPKKVEGYIHGGGMIILLALMMLIMFNDVINLFR